MLVDESSIPGDRVTLTKNTLPSLTVAAGEGPNPTTEIDFSRVTIVSTQSAREGTEGESLPRYAYTPGKRESPQPIPQDTSPMTSIESTNTYYFDT